MLGLAAAAKLKKIPLSNDTVCHRMDNMEANSEIQIIERAKASDWFAIQLEETFSVSILAVLLRGIYIIY